MKRHYYISDNINEFEQVEQQLKDRGITTAHIHVLSLDDTKIANHPQFNDVEAVLRTDVVHSTKIGAVIGVIASTLTMYLVAFMGWAEQFTWAPFIFLAIVVFGLFTWEFGFIGIQRKNNRFARFEVLLNAGNHILFIDIEPDNEALLSQVMGNHPKLIDAGDGPSVPRWFTLMQNKFKLFVKSVP